MLGLLMAFVPDSLLELAVNATLVAGIVGVMSGEILRFIPTLRPYLKVLRTLGYILLVAGVYFKGSYATEMEWRAKVEALKQKVAIAEEQAKTANAQIDNKVITKVQTIHDTKVVTKKVLEVQKEYIDKECSVPQEAINLINAAASGEAPKQ
jgi:hypothetical protein